MKQKQPWIQMLFQRGHGQCAFRNRFQLDFHREMLRGQIAQEPGRSAELRAAALDALDSQDQDIIIQGLAFLLVAGRGEDLPRIAPFTASPYECIQKAAKTCQFELMRRSKMGQQGASADAENRAAEL